MTRIKMSDLIHYKQLFFKNPNLDKEDRRVVGDIIDKLAFPAQWDNDQLRTQTDLEISISYLLSKYHEHNEQKQAHLADLRADFMDEIGEKSPGGVKWASVKAKEEYMSVHYPDYRVELATAVKSAALYFALEHLHKVVWGRNMKLEQLSVNYRRETETDRRST
jgi:hypothetical protein